MLKQWIVLVAVVSVLALACSGSANVEFGGTARSAAMGGAGLALSDESSSSNLINPAAAAASGSRMRFIFPGLDLRTEGASISDLQDRISDISDTDVDEAADLAEDFGKQPTIMTLALQTGVAGSLGVTVEGEAKALINPGESFRIWAQNGAPKTLSEIIDLGIDPLTFTDGTYVTAGYAYSLPAISYGVGIGTGKGKLWAGTKVRLLHSEVKAWDIETDVDGSSVDLEAVERPAVKDQGVGVDLGFIYQPEKSMIQYGLVINNCIEPDLKGIDAPSMVSFGIASQPNPRLTYAIDLVNVNKAYNMGTQLRMGAEWRVARKLALRAGYSGSDLTYGFGVYGMNVAFGKETPAMISRIFWF